MAFILRSSKYVNNFLGLARRANLVFRRKRISILDYTNFFKFNELWSRTAATASPKAVLAFPFNIDKAINHLHNNLKSSMVDLYTVQLTLNSLKDHGVVTPSQFILLLKCCGSAAFRDSEDKRVKMAKNIWETAKELGTEFDIAHYNTLLSVYVENNFKFSPEKILSEIKEAGLEPNRVTYRRLLKAFCQQGNIQGASDMLEQIKEKKFPINEYDFCSLIQGHCEVGELDEAVKIFNVMKERGIQPTLDPYVYLLCGYAKHGDIQKVEELLDELNKADLCMTDTYLLNIIYTLIVNNWAEHIDSILARMKKTSDYDKTLMKVVHRVLHKNKDEEAMKLFGILSKMNYGKEYISNQAHGIIEHFIFNRTINEVVNLCHRMQDEGWTTLAFSHAAKKSVLRKDLAYCSSLLSAFRKNGFPVRSHYFWPLIVRYSEQGNEGIVSVLKVMKSMSIPVCQNTLKMFIREYYQFKDWETDLDILTKHGAKENQICLVLLHHVLTQGNISKAENLASSYGMSKPQRQTLVLLSKCFAKSCPHEEEKFLNILYYLAHDFVIYNSNVSQDVNDGEEDYELTGLSTFFDEALKMLMANCSEDVFLSVLQNASKKKLMIPPQTAEIIRENFSNPDVDILLKEFADSEQFELDQELLKKKSENAVIVPKSLDQNRILNFANRNDLKVEKLWEEVGSEASMEDHLAMLAMYSRMKMYDKAFKVVDRIKDFSGHFDRSNALSKRFRIILHALQNSGDVEKIINTYNVGVQFGFIDENHVKPIIRTLLSRYDVNTAMNKHPEFFGKIRSVGTFLEIMEHLIPAQNTEGIKKMMELFTKATSENVALTALFTAYLASGHKAEARNLLESHPFRFQIGVFLSWFKNTFINSEKSFEDAMDVVKELAAQDRNHIYEMLQSIYAGERDYEKLKMLWLQCQEDNVTDPYFLEHLRQCIRNLEKSSDSSERKLLENEEPAQRQWIEEKELRKIQDLLKMNKYTQDTLDKLLSGKLPMKIARKMLNLLAAEGKSSEIILVINKYRFGRFVPEIASEMLKNNKVKEFMEFVSMQVSMRKYGGVYNCFATQQERIMKVIKTDEEFFQKFKELSRRCYDEGKYEALLVLFIKLCVQLPEKLAEAEELLTMEDSRIMSHFRNYALSNMLLNSTEEVDFYKNVLESEKVKSAFSEALDHFYERVINYYNENGDVESALSYLEKAKMDGVEEKLNKRLINSLKKNLEDRGSTFPYPQLVREVA